MLEILNDVSGRQTYLVSNDGLACRSNHLFIERQVVLKSANGCYYVPPILFQLSKQIRVQGIRRARIELIAFVNEGCAFHVGAVVDVVVPPIAAYIYL